MIFLTLKCKTNLSGNIGKHQKKFSLYHKIIEHASSCLNFNTMAIEAQLNSTYINVFIISIYVPYVKFYGLDYQGFNPLARARNFSHPKNVQMGSYFTHPPIGSLSPGVKWLEHKTGHSHHLLQRLRISGLQFYSPICLKSCAWTALQFTIHNAPKQGGVTYPSLFACIH